MTKKEAKEEIKKLIRKYENLSSGERKAYNEAMTRKDFIMPLFSVLGWDVYNDFIHNEVAEEEPAVKGTVDYSFRLNNIPQFLLEAKGLKIDLDRIEWAKQAVSYGWNMGIEWVILSDFEGLKLFNTSWKIDTPRPNLEFTYKEYLNRFDDLWFFSKESFQKGELDRQTGKWGIKTKRKEVDEKLASDLIEWRKKLFNNFSQWNENRTESDIDEAVQRILDRFIFIRSCEDRKIEAPVLWPAFQKWSQEMKERNFLKTLKPVFSEFDKEYNSNLFQPHFCEELDTEGDPFLEIIHGLYGDKESGVRYNFAAIKPDILGKVYEQYLGHLLQKAGKRGEELGKTKRKKHGIYYTPTFIVDYIVQNALGPVLDNCKTIRDLKKVKVLDPACGSGSFLVRAIEIINDKYKRLGTKGDGFTKIQILTENIYGVDLDEQAVEIARLNLLLSVLDEQVKLPLLSNNIKNGNSLISGTDEDLKKHFGKNFKDKKPFNWEEEFPEVFKQGGFDVIIGNPPYVRVDNLDETDKNYWKESFTSTQGKYDLYYLFIEKSINLLKSDGNLGFIVPNKFCVADSGKKLREIISSSSISSRLISVSRIDIFKGVSNYPVLLFLTKGSNGHEIELGFAEKDKEILNRKFIHFQIGQNKLSILPNKIIPLNVEERDLKLVINLIKKGEKLRDHLKISEGLRIPEKYESKSTEKFRILKQYQFERYSPISDGTFIGRNDLKRVISDTSQRYKNSQKEKIVIAEDALFITATLDKRKMIPQGGVYFATRTKNNVPIKFLLALLNSKLISFVYKVLFGGMHMGGGYLRFRTAFLEELPIKVDGTGQQNQFVELVDNMLKLQEKLSTLTENSDQWYSIKSEIEKIDKKIDQEVYKLYGFTPEEIKIVERNK